MIILSYATMACLPGTLEALYIVYILLCRVCFRYQEVLLSLARQLLQNLQFRYNQSRLDELDDELLDDDVR